MGIKITNTCILTHLLFVDDVLVFLNGLIGDITVFSSAFRSLYFSIVMECNHLKSTLAATGCT